MNKEILKNIENLILSLPEKDIIRGKELLSNKDFETLNILVTSAIMKIRKNRAKENPTEEYLKADLNNLNKLKVLIDEHLSTTYVDNDDDFSEEIFNDEYYGKDIF